MKNYQAGIRFLGFLLFIAMSGAVIAGNIPLKEIPPLHQLTIFKSEIDPNHYILLAKDDIAMDAGNWYVLDLQNGEITSPKLKGESFHWFGGGFDFKFESGQWLYIPGGNSDVTAPGALHELIPAGLIDPMRGREPLQEIAITKELVKELGLTEFVAPRFFEDLQKRDVASKKEKLMVPDEDVAMIVVRYDTNDEKDQELTRSFRDKLLKTRGHAIQVEENYDAGALYIWAFASQIPTIEKQIQEKLHKTSITKRQIIEADGEAAPVSDVESFYNSDTMSQLPSVIATFDQIENSISKLTPEQSEKTVEEISHFIRLLEWNLELINRASHILSHVWDNSNAANEKLVKNFSRPVTDLLGRAYEILHKLNTPLARKILLFGGENGISRVKFLTQRSGSDSETYFQTWLRLLKQKIEWVNRASQTERVGMRIQNSSGGILQQFGFLNVGVKDFTPKSQDRLWYLFEARNMFPLLVFGLSDSPIYRANFIRFVIEADKEAEDQRLSFRDEYDGKLSGNKTLLDVITGLTWVATHKPRTDGIAGFSRERYYSQAMMIISELLNTIRLTIKNSVTYLAILNAALSLQKTVQHEFGVVPNAKSNSPETNELAEQVIHLHKAVQVRMLRGVFGDPLREHEDCPAILGAL
jgi:hypothetical protein